MEIHYINDYIRKNKLKLKKDVIKRKFICDLCGMVLCNPKMTKCECRFCASCIEPFMKESNNCPKCETVLDWEYDIGNRFDLEVKIRKLMITCPNNFCHTKLSVHNLSDHINVCPNNGSKCILSSIGCNDSFKSDSDLNFHLNNEISKHLHLIVNNLETQKICNLEKEINEIKFENTDLKQTLNAQMEAINLLKITIDNLKLEFVNMKAAIANSKSDLVSVKANLAKTMKRQSELDPWPELPESYCKIKIENISNKKNGSFNGEHIKVYQSDKITVNDYNFLIEFIHHLNGNIDFFVKLIHGDKDKELRWPLEKTLKLMLFDDRGIIIDNVTSTSTFSYASVSQTSKVYFHQPKSQNDSIPESCIKIFGRNVMHNDSVSLLLIMMA